MTRFCQVLKNRDFSFLWFGQIISQSGDRLNQMALIALISLRMPGSTLQLAKIISLTIIPVFLIGPIAGVYVDRWDRRRTMMFSDLSRGVLVLLIPFFLLAQKSLIPVYIVIFLVFSITRFFLSAKLSIIPDLVPRGELLSANSLASITGILAFIIGAGLGGIVVEIIGPKGGFYLDALSYLVSAALIFSIVGRFKTHFRISKRKLIEFRREIETAIKKSFLEDLKDGLIYLWNQKYVRFVIATLFLVASGLGAVYVVAIVFIQNTLHSITRDLGLLALFLGPGLLLGAILYGRFGEKLSRVKIIFFSLLVGGLILMNFALALKAFPSFRLAALLSFIFGVSVAPIVISANTLIHEIISTEMRGRVFSAIEFAVHGGFLLFMFLASFAAEYFNEFVVLLGVGMAFFLLGLIGALRYIRVKT